ncbi:hypothetical protein HH308_06800 [Gordonia sp. TBRC 11910]|uniref:Uncharacterized protein n=1 Tax=Gordonia asplenii TaxID=2725283 RepID=A0A848KXJ6_9ACTN|nr:hypothetical protein [Gordonia asplenii]NMO00921.1 hypothetical protein [Gordonia asplenii]
MSGQRNSVTRRFGIGTVVAICSVLLVAAVGVVLSIKTPPATGDGRLRDYSSAPDVAWTVDRDTLPGYGEGTEITVAGTWMDRWLLAYPSGLGRAYLMVSAVSGHPVWDNPIRVGLGGCALNGDGIVGCAMRLGDHPDGFYLADLDTGKLSAPTDLDATTQVVGLGQNFVRIDDAGYRVMLSKPSGEEIWTRTFASATTARYDDGVLVATGSDGTNVVLDAATGAGELSCTACDISLYPTGIAVQHNTYGHEGVDFYGIVDGVLNTSQPTYRATRIQLVRGRSTLPVLTGVGEATVQDTQGHFEIRDPAKPKALWAITDPELSKAGARPCGGAVSFALKDRSRVVYRLSDGRSLGKGPSPDVGNPDADIDQLTCVGASPSTMVFANNNQLNGFRIADGTHWELPIIGTAQAVDGYIVLHQGQSMSVLAPN